MYSYGRLLSIDTKISTNHLCMTSLWSHNMSTPSKIIWAKNVFYVQNHKNMWSSWDVFLLNMLETDDSNCKQSLECISLQIFFKITKILKSRDYTNPSWSPNFESLPHPREVVSSNFFAKMREKDELKGTWSNNILPLGCVFLSTWVKTVWGIVVLLNVLFCFYQNYLKS